MKKHLQIHGILRRALSMALAAAIALGLAPAFTPGSQPPGILSAPAALAAEQATAKEPLIDLHPADSTYAKEATARFYVRATSLDGGYLSYQWYISQSDTDTGTEIPNATSSVLTTTTPNEPDTYYYWAAITNTLGGSTSEPVVTNKAKTKIVDRQLEDHIINGDFSTIIDKGFDNGIRSDNKGWGSFPNEMIPGWDTTHFQVNQPADKRAYAGKQYEIQSLNNAMPSPVSGSGNTTPDDTTAGHGVNGSNTAPYYVCELADQDYSSIYQEIATVPGKIYEWSLQHSAINTSQKDVMAVVIGAAINEKSDYGNDIAYRWVDPIQVHDSTAPYVGDYTYEYPYGRHASAVYEYGSVPSGKTAGAPNYDESSTYFYDILMKLSKETYNGANPTVFKDHAGESYSIAYNGSVYYVYIASSGTKWTNYSGSYTVPAGQGTTVFSFVGISSPSPAAGNFLDNVVFASGTAPTTIQEINYTGDTKLSVDTKNGFAYALAEVRGSSVVVLQGLDARYDTDGPGGSPEAVISPNTVFGTGHWYSSPAINDYGVLTFYGLTPGKTYRVIGIPAAAINADLRTNESPADVLDDGYYTDVKIVPAKNDDEGGVVASVTSGIDGETAFITIENSLSRVEYALLPATGDPPKPNTAAPVEKCGWTYGGGELRFENLEPETVYFLVVRPLGYTEIDYAAAARDGVLEIRTPEEGQDITETQVSREPGGASISITGTKAGYTYALVDPDSGEILDSKGPAEAGGTVTFTVKAGGTYRAVAKPQTGGYMKGVRVYPYPAALKIDYERDRVQTPEGDGYIPATIEYSLNGGDNWITGTGSEFIDLTEALKTDGGTVAYRLSAGDFADARVQPALKLDFDARPNAPVSGTAFTVNYTAEQIENKGSADIQYRAGSSGAWETLEASKSAAFSSATVGWTAASGGNIDLRFPASASQTDGKFASLTVNAPIAPRPTAPVGLLATLVNAGNPSQGLTVTGLTQDTTTYYSYRSRPTGDWSSAALGSAIPTLTYDTGYDGYDFRFAATTSAPASRAVTVKPDPISLSATSLARLTYGYTTTGSSTVTIKNIDTANETITVNLALSGDNAFILSSDSATVPKNNGTQTVNITPNAGLDAGTYTATLTATYDTNKTFSTEITLDVEKANWIMPTSGTVSAQTANSFAVTVNGLPAGATLKWQLGATPSTPTPAEGGVYAFGGLNARTAYTVNVRAEGDKNHNESTLVQLTTAYTAMPTPEAEEVVKINFRDEILEFASVSPSGEAVLPGNYTVTVKTDNDKEIHNGAPLTAYADTGFTLSVVRNGSPGTYPASEPSELIIAGRSPAPGFTTTAATTNLSADGAINCDGSFQYRINTAGDAVTWTDATNKATVRAGKYDVRKSATSSAFASSFATGEVSYNNRVVAINRIDANGEAGTASTTALTVTFDMPVTDFGSATVEFTGENAGLFRVTGAHVHGTGGTGNTSAVWDVTVAENKAAAANESKTPTLTLKISGWKTGGEIGYAFEGGSATSTVTVNRAVPDTTPAAQIDYINEKLTGLTAGASYMIDGATRTADGSGTLAIESTWMTGAEHTIVKIAAGANINSAAQSLEIKARPAMPDGTVADPATQGAQGSITLTGSGAGWEYQALNAADGWKPVSGSTITELSGVYSVRVKATTSSFASNAKAFRIHTFNEVDFDSVYVGYSSVTTWNITGDENDFAVALTAGDTYFNLNTSDKTIVPKPGLQAGSYEGKITITYTASTSTQNVKFTVHPKAEIASVATSSTKDNGEYKGITDTLTITFARAITLNYSDVTVSGAAVKNGPNFTDDGSGERTTYKLSITPASMANKTGDPITVSIRLGPEYYYQISDTGTDTLQYKSDESDSTPDTIVIPRAIKTAKAVTLIDGYSTSFIQFTLAREDENDSNKKYYPITSSAIEAADATAAAYAGPIKIEYQDGGALTPTYVLKIDNDLDYTFRVTFIPQKSGDVKISIPEFGIEPAAVTGTIQEKPVHFTTLLYMLGDANGRGYNILTDADDAHQIAPSQSYAGSQVLVAPTYVLRLDKEFADWTVEDVHIHAADEHGDREAARTTLELNKDYTVTGVGAKQYAIDGAAGSLTDQLQITLNGGWATADGTYFIHAVLKKGGDYAPLAVKVTLTGLTPSYILTVSGEGAQGSGRYPANADVHVTAPATLGEGAAEQVFHEWQVSAAEGKTAGSFVDPLSASTYYRTTDADATLTPVYKTRPAAPQAEIDYVAERLTGLELNTTYYNYTLQSGARGMFTANDQGEYAFPANDAWLPAIGEWDFTLTKAATTADPESHPQTLTFPARGPSPGASGEPETFKGFGDGKLIIDNGGAAEYRAVAATAWTAVPGAEVPGLAPGDYLVRSKGDNTKREFASQSAPVTIPASNTPPTWEVSLDKSDTVTFTAKDYGYTAITPMTVTVSNTGNQPTGILTAALSGQNPGNFTLSTASLADIARYDTGTFNVTPNAELGVGTYSATVTVSGNNSLAAPYNTTFDPKSFNVSFTVNPAAISGFDSLELVDAGNLDQIKSDPTYEKYQNASIISTLKTERDTITAHYAGSTDGVEITVDSWAISGKAYDDTVAGEYIFEATPASVPSYLQVTGDTPTAIVSVKVHEITHGIVFGETGYAFPEAQYGYGSTSKEITVTNIGVQETGALSVVKEDANNAFYVLSEVGSITDASGTIEVSVNPGLSPGTYTAKLTVSSRDSNGLVPKTYALSFKVTAAEITAPTVLPAIDGGIAEGFGAKPFANAADVIALLSTDSKYINAQMPATNRQTPDVTISGWADTDKFDPLVAGSYTFTGTVTITQPSNFINPYGHAATVEVVVAEPVHAETPKIDKNPVSIDGGIVGASYTLEINASVSDNGDLSYQWYSGTASEHASGNGTPITGATGESYAVPADAPGSVYYWCVITNENPGVALTGKTTATRKSAPALVTLRYATLTVVNGTISDGAYAGEATGYFAVGDKVTVSAAEPPSGQIFSAWTPTAGVTVTPLPAKESGEITMPAGDVELTATYKTSPYFPITDNPTNSNTTNKPDAETPSSTTTVTADNGKVQLDYKASDGGVTISLPENKVGEIIKNVTGGEASFDVSKVDGAYSVTFTPKSGLSEIAEDGLKIKVIFPSGVVTLDAGAAKSLISQAHGTEITFEVKEMKAAELTAAQSSALPGTPEAFDVSVYSGGEAIHSYAGELIITVAYTGKLPVSVWYVSDAGATEKLPSTYSTQNKTVTFKPPHLSLYAVGYDGLPFDDIFESDWYFGDVEFVYAAGLMTGTTETTFAPKTPVTRAMMVTVLGRHANANSQSSASAFTDVDANAYYAPYVAWASENGIVLGVGDNSFAPDREITRQELVTLLYRYAQLTGNAPTGNWAVRIPFNDADKLSDWAVEAVMWAYMNGLATGKPGNLFDPPGTASRAETAALLHRFVALLDDPEDSEDADAAPSP